MLCVQSRKYPIHCPDPGCHLELGVDDITRLLADDTQQMQVHRHTKHSSQYRHYTHAHTAAGNCMQDMLHVAEHTLREVSGQVC